MVFPDFMDEISKRWNWLTGKDTAVEQSLADTLPSPKPTAIAENLGPVERASSLAGEMLLLMVSGLKLTTTKAKESYDRCKLEADKNRLFTSLLAEMSEHMNDEGGCSTTSPKLQELFAQTAIHGVQVAKSKTSLTKKEVDGIRHKLEGLINNCQHELKLHSHDIQKCENDHRTFVQEVKSLFDKYFEIIRKFLMGIVSR
jgi:hypothetical protein